MADDRRKAYQPNSIVASAALLTAEKVNRLPPSSEWGNEAWGFYDTVPEVRFATGWLANALSRCRIMAATRGEGGDEPAPIVEPPESDEIPEGMDAPVGLSTEEQTAFDLMSQFAGGTQGQSQILAGSAVQLTVPGAGYIVGEPNGVEIDGVDLDGAETWQVLSTDELKVRGDRFEVVIGDSESAKTRPLSTDALAIRIWRAHHRWHAKPDSPMRACLPALRELALLSQHIDATAVSRLAGAGLLLIAKEITFPVSEANRNKADPFMAELIDTMMTPIKNRDSAAAIVPLPVRIPAEYVDKVKHITFSTPLDDKAMALRDEAVRRFAAGMDMPAEIVMGLGDSNHWTAWQIEESALKLHIEPMLESICLGLTIGFLQPALKALGINNPNLIVWYDTSELTVRPDRSGDAKSNFDVGVIGSKALLRETGFSEDDRPDPDEEQRNLLIRLVTGAPSLAPALLPLLGVNVDPSLFPNMGDRPAEPPADDAPADNAPPPTRDEEPPPPDDDEQSAALLAAADGIIVRALEMAGRRLSNQAKRGGAAVSCERPELVHTCVSEDLRVAGARNGLLDGAWERVPEIATRYGVEPVALQSALESYTQRLILAGWPHEYDSMAQALGA